MRRCSPLCANGLKQAENQALKASVTHVRGLVQYTGKCAPLRLPINRSLSGHGFTPGQNRGSPIVSELAWVVETGLHPYTSTIASLMNGTTPSPFHPKSR